MYLYHRANHPMRSVAPPLGWTMLASAMTTHVLALAKNNSSKAHTCVKEMAEMVRADESCETAVVVAVTVVLAAMTIRVMVGVLTDVTETV